MFIFLIYHYISKNCPLMFLPEILAIYFGLPLDAATIFGIVYLFKKFILFSS